MTGCISVKARCFDEESINLQQFEEGHEVQRINAVKHAIPDLWVVSDFLSPDARIAAHAGSQRVHAL